MPSAVLVINKHSGTLLAAAEDPTERIVGLLEDSGIDTTTLDGEVSEQLERSAETKADVVVVAGGDGTIRSTIAKHRGKGRPIGIIPAGTMNLLAHDYNIPVEIEDAVRTIAGGHTIPVDYGLIDEKVFLHTCFMGLPVRIGRHREDMRGKMSPLDRLRLAFHAIRSLAKDPKLTLVPQGGAAPARMVSPSYAILVGTMGDTLIPRPLRETVTGGQMTVFAIHPENGADIARMIVKGAFGFLSEDEDIDKYVVTSCEVSGPRRKLRAMLDGEDVLVASPAAVKIVSGEVEVFAEPKRAS